MRARGLPSPTAQPARATNGGSGAAAGVEVQPQHRLRQPGPSACRTVALGLRGCRSVGRGWGRAQAHVEVDDGLPHGGVRAVAPGPACLHEVDPVRAGMTAAGGGGGEDLGEDGEAGGGVVVVHLREI